MSASTEPIIRPKIYPKGYIAQPTNTISLIALNAEVTDSFVVAAWLASPRKISQMITAQPIIPIINPSNTEI